MASNPLVGNPNYAPVANGFFPITTAVNSLASAKESQNGPFRGIFARVPGSFTIVKNDVELTVLNPLFGITFWIQGDYISTIEATGTASPIYGVL